MLGASGSLEAIITILSLTNQIVIKNANLINYDYECGNLPLALENKKTNINFAMSNSFGFGGTNSSVIFNKL